MPAKRLTPAWKDSVATHHLAPHGQHFYSTQNPGVLTKTKTPTPNCGFRDRRKQTLFIDARKLGTLIDRVPFNFSNN